MKHFSKETFLPVLFLVLTTVLSIFTHLQMPRTGISSERLMHLHYHMGIFRISGDENKFTENPTGRVFYEDKPVVGIGGEETIEFTYSNKDKDWSGIFPIPWSAPNGFYTLELDDGSSLRFLVKSRLPYDSKDKVLKVMNLENTRRISRLNYPLPSGEQVGYGSIFEWVKYLGGNTLWYLGGQTASYNPGDLDIDFPWLKPNVQTLEEFASAAKESGIDFGAWLICYRAFGLSRLKPDQYNYSMNYRGGKIVESDGISIKDVRRLRHIKEFVDYLNKVEDIDYIGLDYIRPSGGAFELVDDFVGSMRIKTPEGFEKLSHHERMEWLGALVSRQTNRDFEITEKWNWWRAHRVSLIINEIRESVELKKPLWAFVLSWELGHQHGQDPVMFTDAGIDYLSIMMYETDARRFNHLIKEWEAGTKGFKLNLIPGNQIDWPLHQNTVYPSGPEEFTRRIDSSIEHLKDNIQGVFINDLSRAFAGRRGPYTSKEWLMAAGDAYRRSDLGNKLNIAIEIPESKTHLDQIEGVVILENISNKEIKNITLDFPDLEGLNITPKKRVIEHLDSSSSAAIGFRVRINSDSSRRLGRYMLAARAVTGEGDTLVAYSSIWVKGHPPDPGWEYR